MTHYFQILQGKWDRIFTKKGAKMGQMPYIWGAPLEMGYSGKPVVKRTTDLIQTYLGGGSHLPSEDASQQE